MPDGSDTPSQSPTAAYLAEANEWSRDKFDRALGRARLAYVIGALGLVLATVSVVAVAVLAPLKTTDSYLVVVDRSTGQVEPLINLKKDPQQVLTMTETELVTKGQLAMYVIARETFDLTDIEQRHTQVRRTSENKLFDDYDKTFRGPAEVNPFKLYDRSVRSITVKSVEFFNDRTGQVRFQATLKKEGAVTTSHWVSIVQFRYVQSPGQLNDRLANPLGFQVTSYRVDQESVQ